METDQYKEEVDSYLSKKWGLISISQVQGYINDGYQLIGRIDLLINGLKDNSSEIDKWNEFKNQIQNRIDEVRIKYSHIL